GQPGYHRPDIRIEGEASSARRRGLDLGFDRIRGGGHTWLTMVLDRCPASWHLAWLRALVPEQAPGGRPTGGGRSPRRVGSGGQGKRSAARSLRPEVGGV